MKCKHKIVRRNCCECSNRCDIRDGNNFIRPFVVANLSDADEYRNAFIYTEDTLIIYYIDADGTVTEVEESLRVTLQDGTFITNLQIKI